MKRTIGLTFITYSVLALLVGCNDGSGGGSGGPALSGTYSGTAGSSTPIVFYLQQSGTQVSGTVDFQSYTYNLTGNISGDTFAFTAQNKSNPTYCRNLDSTSLSVTSDRSEFTGRLTVTNVNCDGTGPISGGTSTVKAMRQ